MEITNTRDLDKHITVTYANDGRDRLRGFDVWDRDNPPELTEETKKWMENNNLVMFYGMFGWAFATKPYPGSNISCGTASRVKINQVVLDRESK